MSCSQLLQTLLFGLDSCNVACIPLVFTLFVMYKLCRAELMKKSNGVYFPEEVHSFLYSNKTTFSDLTS